MKQNPVVPAQARPTMKLRIAENFRAVFYAPFYAIRALAEGNTMCSAPTARGPTCYTTFITSRDSVAKRREEFAALERATQAMLDWVAKEGPGELARVTASFFPDVPQELLRSAFERYHRAGLWSRTTAVSKAGFERLAYSLHDGGFIARRATYADCVQDFGRRT